MTAPRAVGPSGRTLLLALLLALLIAPIHAQKMPVPIPKEDLAAFVDGMFDIQLKRDDAAGAVLLFAQQGTPLLSQGYGLADVAKAKAMTDQTVLRAGAITAPIIAVAVMQQVEAGKLSLDADLSLSLDLPLEARPDGPITLRQLLTHTAGFAGTPPQSAVSPTAANDLKTFLQHDPPRRIFPAGKVHSFSPYGLALAAYAVERVTHQPFPDYAQASIFAPLKMTGSSLLEPLPAELQARASPGYGPSGEPPLPPERLGPARSLSTTAADMGRFGEMLLAHGTLEGQKILTAESVHTILSRQKAEDLSPQIPGMALAFHEIWFNGLHFFGLPGDTAAFHSELEIEPEHGLVLFLAYNSSGHPVPEPHLPGEPSRLATYARGELIHGVIDRYQPFHPKIQTLTPTPEDEHLVTGTWIRAEELGLAADRAHIFHATISNTGLNTGPKATGLKAAADSSTPSLIVDRFVSDRGSIKRWLLLQPNLWLQYPQDLLFAIKGRDGLPDRLARAADPTTDLVRAPAP